MQEKVLIQVLRNQLALLKALVIMSKLPDLQASSVWKLMLEECERDTEELMKELSNVSRRKRS